MAVAAELQLALARQQHYRALSGGNPWTPGQPVSSHRPHRGTTELNCDAVHRQARHIHDKGRGDSAGDIPVASRFISAGGASTPFHSQNTTATLDNVLPATSVLMVLALGA